ncbi:TonB-dependent receptor, partial [Fulvivirga sp. RKSG066]|uniref:TonB-dependent receptor domain-containing protein n=1 Tax=Fulvivirga aurantia TaxID=2529383 RepID=UPI0012BCE484
LQVSFVSYKKLTIEGVVVNSGEVTLLENIRLSEDVEELAEVVVTAEAIKTTEEAILTVKRKSANVLDGVSSANFRKIGDSDAAAAVKRVPGVSIEGGKYVYVRGLGDRYTKSILNGVDIPGLDPDRNTLQMDIFPTNVIDNIIVLKSFTSDLPADFVGGLVNIDLKDFPEEKVVKVSASLGYNPNMHFNKDYLTYEGGSTDFLGFDDGTRDIPTKGISDVPQFAEIVGSNGARRQQYLDILNGFNPTLDAMREQSFMNYGLGLSMGNQVAAGNSTIGYNFALTYKNDTEYYEDAIYGRYGQDQLDASETELERREYQKGDYGVNNVLLGGLAGLALKNDLAKYRLNILHLQNGESKAGKFDYVNSDQGANFEAVQSNLEYSQRSLTNILLNGTHVNSAGDWEIDWKLSPTLSKINDPDIRFTRIRTDNSNPSIGTESGLPERIWRTLEEYNAVGKVDLTKRYELFGEDAKLKFGSSYTYKNRDYNIESFQIIPFNVEVTMNPDDLFKEENLYPNLDGNDGTRYEPTFIPINPNDYNSNISNAGVYVSNEMSLTEKLKTIVGVRVESYQQYYTGQNQTGAIVLDNEKVLDDLDFFP